MLHFKVKFNWLYIHFLKLNCEFFFCFQNWHGIISSSLAGLLLLGTSTLIGITLIIQSELDTRKSPKMHLTSGMRGVIGISWLLPILYTVALQLIYTVMGDWPNKWWLDVKSLGFVLFVVIELLFVLLFCLLIFTLFQKLLYLAKKHDKHNTSILKRWVVWLYCGRYYTTYKTKKPIYNCWLNWGCVMRKMYFNLWHFLHNEKHTHHITFAGFCICRSNFIFFSKVSKW